MRISTGCVALAAAGCLALLTPASAVQTFSYSSNFNSEAHWDIPGGWVAQDANQSNLPPAVMKHDPVYWHVLGGWEQNFNVGWSGGGRFVLIHPAETPSGWQRAVSAWYHGNNGPHTGTYPLAMQTNKLKVEFDFQIRGGRAGCDGDGMTFALQPVLDLAQDVQRVGGVGGGLAWAGIDGLAIEFDVYGNSADPAGTDNNNHVGIDVNLLWQGGDQLPSLATQLDAPVSMPENYIPRFVTVSNNNQPIHVTVFYNDPDEGGAGVVRVYMKVDPATKDPNESGGQYSFGMSSGPYGMRVAQACVGAWPTTQGIFGFTAATGGCDAVFAVDNVTVSTDDATSGTACVPANLPPGQESPRVVLDTAARAAACNDPTLSQPGWDVKTYQPAGYGVAALKDSIYAVETYGSGPMASVVGEQDINYEDNSCPGLFGSSRSFPGITPPNSNFGMLAKGWVCFPAAGDYMLEVRSDDGFELTFGAGTTNQVVSLYDGGRGCNDQGTRITLQVDQAGVYPIQLLYFNGSGPAGIEFYRILSASAFLMAERQSLIGTSTSGLTDQPLVYGMCQGVTAPVIDFTPAVVELDPGQKVAGAGTGDRVFSIKTVTAPYNLNMMYQRDDDGDIAGLKMLELMQDRSGGATAATVNFRGTTSEPDGAIPDGVVFPEVSGDQFGMRASGYATFPAAGIYDLWIEHDDNATLKLGNQTIYAGAVQGSSYIALNVTVPGTYPIRVEYLENSGDGRVELGQLVTGVGLVPVNGTGSTIAVYQSASSGAFAWASRATPIPAARKIANVGQGTNSGWNCVLAKSNDVNLAGSITRLEIRSTGLGSLLIENNFQDFVGHSFPRGTDSPTFVDYIDVNGAQSSDRFNSDRLVTSFGSVVNSAGNNDDLAISATGYIQFSNPGIYGLSFNADDGANLWVAGRLVATWPFPSGCEDATPAVLNVEEAGIYDIRADYFERGGGLSFEIFAYRPDGSRALINSAESAAAGINVYRTLSTAPASTAYANPLKVPASAKIAETGAGKDSGFRVQTVVRDFLPGGTGDRVRGGDPFRYNGHATEMLNAVLDGMPSLNQHGTLVADTTVQQINFTQLSEFPGTGLSDDFAIRATGYIELAAGGHLFEIAADNGFDLWIGGQNPPVDGYHVAVLPSQDNNTVQFYVSVEQAGIYKLVLDQHERSGGEECIFREFRRSSTGAMNALVVNGDNNSSRVYTTLQGCNTPFADTDDDGDVDGLDFAAFQLCMTGPGGGVLAGCECLNRDGDNDIDLDDLADFELCKSGPDVPANPNCGN